MIYIPDSKTLLYPDDMLRLGMAGNPSNEALAKLGGVRVTPSTAPEIGPHQFVRRTYPVQNESGEWVETWELVDMFTESGFDVVAGTEASIEDQKARYDAESLAAEKRLAKSRVLEQIERFLSCFTAGVPLPEMVSWPAKAAEAAQYLAGNESVLIEAEAQARGVTGQEMAQIIATKADAYSGIIYRTSGLRSATEAAIDGATSETEVWSAVDSAKSQAATMAAALGLQFP